MKRAFALCSLIALQFACKAEVAPHSLQRFQANYGPGCNIAAWMPQSGRDGGLGSDPATGLGGLAVNPIPKSWKSSLTALGFGLSCKPAEGPGSLQTFGVFDTEERQWKKDPAAMRRLLRESNDSYQINNAERIVATTNVYDIKTTNAYGWAETFEDITGVEEHRQKHMVFCVFNLPSAVCGIRSVAYMADGPKGDLTHRALKIIQSIELLPDEPATDPEDHPAEKPPTEPAPCTEQGAEPRRNTK